MRSANIEALREEALRTGTLPLETILGLLQELRTLRGLAELRSKVIESFGRRIEIQAELLTQQARRPNALYDPSDLLEAVEHV